MDRAQKSELVTTLHQVFATAGVVVVTQNLGLTVAQSNDLRRRMVEAGATVKVAKNRLAKLALEGTDAKDIAGLFSGPTMIAHSSDPVVAPKITSEFAKQHAKFVILGAALGRSVLDAEGVKALAELPSLDELRAKLVGMIQTPATRIAGILQAPGAQIARVLSAHASKVDATADKAA